MVVIHSLFTSFFYPPATKASREVANLTERKNPHALVNGVKELVRLSVCLSVTNFDLNYLGSGRIVDLSSNQNQKPFETKFATLAVRAVYVSSFLLKKQLIYDFLAGNKNPNLPHCV